MDMLSRMWVCLTTLPWKWNRLLDAEYGTKMKYVWAVKLLWRKQERSSLCRYFAGNNVYALLFREMVSINLLIFKQNRYRCFRENHHNFMCFFSSHLRAHSFWSVNDRIHRIPTCEGWNLQVQNMHELCSAVQVSARGTNTHTVGI
jgi:hypothetical protein